MIFIVKGQDEINLASEQAGVDVMVIGLDQPKSAKLCKNLYVHFCQYYWIKVMLWNIMLESFQLRRFFCPRSF